MNAKFLSFIVVFALYSGFARANGNECPTYVEPEITITPFFDEPEYNHDLPIQELKALSEGGDMMTDDQKDLLAQESSRVGGLTRYNIAPENKGTIQSYITTYRGVTKYSPALQSNNTINSYTMANNNICAQISKIDLSLSIKDTIVYIGNEFPVDSCSYRTILDHELKHVETAKIFLDAFPPVAEDHMRTFLRRVGVVHVRDDPSGKEAQNRINRDFGEYMKSLSRELEGALVIMQSKVDSREEYERVARSCNGETQRIFNRSAN
jgi:hypothetical protein